MTSNAATPQGLAKGQVPVYEVLTIGHSNLAASRFIELLRQTRVDLIVDTRSHPVSRHVPHFDMPELRILLSRAGLRYVYMGHELGGRPEDRRMYDPEGYVLYWRVAATPDFQRGIARILHMAHHDKLAILCSEEDPICCHRRLLVGRVLEEKGLRINHVRGDGRIESEESVRTRESDLQQIPLFDSEEREWKSSLSVLHRSRPQSSSVRSDKAAYEA